jgi:23S rRNA (uracil1939-C5)-methyltransferase
MPLLDLKIEKLVYGGEGLGHHNGSTVFVPFVLPEERVEAQPVEQKKKFVRAHLEKILEASAARIAPRCPYFAECGGCDYQHIPYKAQLGFKSEILRETLRRVGRVEWAGPIAVHRSPEWGYRNRAQWKTRQLHESNRRGTALAVPKNADHSGVSTPEVASSQRLGIGYFRANSTTLCAVDECAILAPSLLNAFQAICEALAQDSFPRELREIEAFTSEGAEGGDAKLLLTFSFAGFPSRAKELAEIIRSLLPQAESILLFDPARERMELFGPGYIEPTVGAAQFRVGHFSFFQVNRFLTEELVRTVAQVESGGRLALDLFAGVGLFSLPLAETFQRVIAVESNPAAARDLKTNARATPSVDVRDADVERFLEKFKETPDLIVLDPPRAGMPRQALDRLLRIAPERITYVSCEPPTLARDLAAMVAAKYEITELHLFDLFPQTFHMEAVTRLRQRP